MVTEGYCAGVILAAGKSSRLGQSKQLLRLDGKTLLQHVIEAAQQSILRESVVVLGAQADEVEASIPETLLDGVRLVRNPQYDTGQASSIAAGLRALDQDIEAAVILLADQPGISGDLIDRVVEAYGENRMAIVRPVFGPNRVPGHPVVLARSIWPDVLALTGDEGARRLIAARPSDLLEIEIDTPPPPDVDTIEDYQRIRDSRPGLI
jgi:molybdenum cofactor cytidylyltransferase